MRSAGRRCVSPSACAIRSADRERTQSVLLNDGRTVNVRRWAGEGVPVVLLHGLLDSSRGWSSTARALRHPTVAIDLAGFGRSDLPARPRLSSYAEDVTDVLALLRLDRFVLVGHSFGGGVAAAVAEMMPDEVAALILLAPVGFGRIQLAEATMLPGVRAVLRRVLPLALTHQPLVSAAYRAMVTAGTDPEEALLGDLSDRPSALVAATCEATRAIVAAGRSPRAFHRRGVRYPGVVHAVWGSGDRVVPVAHLANLERAFPHVQPKVWQGVGHHHQREQPARLLRLIRRACAAAELPTIGPRRSRAPTHAPTPEVTSLYAASPSARSKAAVG
jgi:pimeloyl-ACP methyl ester carboxylesterase